jgi:hypothetical protein
VPSHPYTENEPKLTSFACRYPPDPQVSIFTQSVTHAAVCVLVLFQRETTCVVVGIIWWHDCLPFRCSLAESGFRSDCYEEQAKPLTLAQSAAAAHRRDFPSDWAASHSKAKRAMPIIRPD